MKDVLINEVLFYRVAQKASAAFEIMAENL